MIARRLNVYKETYNLVKMLMRMQTTFEKQYRYALGAQMQSTAIRLFGHLQRANTYVGERTAHLEAFIVDFEELKTLMRLAFDFSQIGKKGQAAIYDACESIGRQISAWKNSAAKKACPETMGSTRRMQYQSPQRAY